MKYVYPVVFENAEEGGFNVSVPDIKGCFTCGDDMAESIEMAADAMEMMLVHYEDEGTEIPAPSNIEDIKSSGIVSLVVADTDRWRKEFDNKAVKKTLTIPSWLNSKAEKANINFSQLLQESLCQKLGVSL